MGEVVDLASRRPQPEIPACPCCRRPIGDMPYYNTMWAFDPEEIEAAREELSPAAVRAAMREAAFITTWSIGCGLVMIAVARLLL